MVSETIEEKRHAGLVCAHIDQRFSIYSSDASSWKRAHELLVEVAAHGEMTGLEVPCLLIATKDDLEPDASCIQSSARVWIIYFLPLDLSSSCCL